MFKTNFFCSLLLLLFTHKTLGQYEAEFLASVPENPTGVTVDSAGLAVTILENRPIQDDTENERLNFIAWIKYTGDEPPTVASVTPNQLVPTLSIVRATDGLFYLKLTNELDFESAVRYWVVALEPSARFAVYVGDINDQFPVFTSLPNQLSVVEKTFPVPILHTYVATDDDTAETITYTMLDLQNGDNTPFEIDESRGDLNLRRAVDYREQTVYRIQVMATDNNGIHTSNAPITTINVEDTPDLPPIWDTFSYILEITENNLETQFLQTYRAFDGDYGVGSGMNYSLSEVPIEAESEEPYLIIDSITGDLSTNVVFNAETAPESFVFQVIATEVLPPSMETSITVTIVVRDQNDNSPIFTLNGENNMTFDVRIPENTIGALPGLEDFTIHDADIGLGNNAFTATLIVEGDTETEAWLNEKFRIIPPSGNGEVTFALQISPTAVIDFEEDERWLETILFKVRVAETNAPDSYAEAVISLKVDDVNDNTPQFTGLSANGNIELPVRETQTGSIGFITAVDRDISEVFGTNSIKYRWSNNAPTKLHLDEDSGEITTIGDEDGGNIFDAETLSFEVYVVEAVDMDGEGQDSRSTTVILRLMISDENDEAPIINLPSNNIRIPENMTLASNPDPLLEFDIRDPDSSAQLTVTCEVIGPEETRDWFHCTPTAGENTQRLTVSLFLGAEAELDFEIISRVDIRITATDSETVDGYVESTSIILPVNVENVNDEPPIFVDPLLIFVYETLQCQESNECENENERMIHTFRATDTDTNPQDFIYEIFSIYLPMNDLVEIGENDGILRRVEGVMIDREASYVGDIESDIIGILVYNVTVSNVNYPELFDRIEVEVTIYDINDNAPVFQSPGTNFEVLENMVSVLEIAFIATDEDSGRFGTVNYFFDESYNGGEGLEKFSIDRLSGVVSIIEAINREENEEYTLRVVARDNGGSTSNSEQATHDINISIMDVNDNAPTFSSEAFFERNENEAGVDTILGTVQIRDIDQADHDNSRVEAELQGVIWDCRNCEGMIWNDYFQGNFINNIFTVTSKQSFLTFFGTFYIQITARDFGDPFQENDQTFELRIHDINDNAPVMVFPEEDTRVYVNESLGVGDQLVEWDLSPIDYILATDADDRDTPNGQITYSIGDEGNANDFFEIKTDEDEEGRSYLVVKAQLTSSYEPILVNIFATDRASPPLFTNVIMRITVVPAQNAPPLFQNGVQEVTFEENKNDEAINLEESVDPDTTDIGNIFEEQICYFIVGGDDEGSFTLNQNTNRLSLVRSLDRELISSYELLIYAKNDRIGFCRPPLTLPDLESESILHVNVQVADVIDTTPLFTNAGPVISGGIKTSAVTRSSTSIILQAYDPDLLDVLQFTIDESSMFRSHPSLDLIQTPVFILSEENEILIGFQANNAMQGYFRFQVSVRDSSNLYSEAECKIYFTTESHEVEFRFNNDPEVFDEGNILEQVADIMTQIYEDRCVIENRRPTTDESGNALAGKTTLEVHFIDESLDEPVFAYLIDNLRFDNPARFVNLTTELSAIGLELDFLSYFGDTPSEVSNILTYILIAAVGVLAVVLVILSVTCWFNSRRLSLRVRALTASTFGSQQSGLNKIGGEYELPNTNQHAVKGSNPIWSTEPTNFHEFDTESVGSGGSVLIGVENDDDFRNYKGDDESIGSIRSEDDFQFNFANTRGTTNPLFQIGEIDDGDFNMPPASVIRRNPLIQ